MIPRKISMLLLVFLLGAALLFPAHITGNDLHLEILLYQGNQLSIKSNGTIKVAEYKSPIQRDIRGDFSLSLQNDGTLSYYGILNRVEPFIYPEWNAESEIARWLTESDDDPNIRTHFTWNDGRLGLQKEKMIFEDISFRDLESAQAYATETGIPKKNVMPISMIGSQVRVSLSTGSIKYFELPLYLSTIEDIYVNNDKLDFRGEFVLKAIGGNLV
ncbi:MAG: hypothetical protein U1C33_07190, partial [Candidatus Cloacimonadaceae bacterium]|nr:hypothetical protein [Candidatus Cloacimonadaceae bacterium]